MKKIRDVHCAPGIGNRMKRIINEMKMRLVATGVNESVSRACISAFVADLNPRVEELCDLRCAVSEAVTNSIVHAYRGMGKERPRYIYISARIYDNREVTVEIADTGCGIEDIERARTPMFTTGEHGERCGMGFLVMENFTDSVSVKSKVGKGTTVLLRKFFTP